MIIGNIFFQRVFGQRCHPKLAIVRACYAMEKRAERQKWEKNEKNVENLPRPKMGKKWPKNAEKMENWPDVPFFRHFSAIPCPSFP